MTEKMAQVKAQRDDMIRKVFTGESNRFLVIIGPCSADNEDVGLRLHLPSGKMQEKVADKS